MALFVLSDTHLSLTVNKPMDVFGQRWNGHAEKIAYYMHSFVKPEDTVVIPGDISWGMTPGEALDDFRFLDRLPGRKIIGKGNHDFWWSTVTKISSFFEKEGLTTLSLLFNNAYPVGDYAVCGTRGWFFDSTSPAGADRDKIVAREAGRLRRSLEAGKALGRRETVAFLHFPPVFMDFVCPELTGILEEYGVRRCYYGHIHGQYSMPPSFSYHGVEYIIATGDYLQFRPLKVGD